MPYTVEIDYYNSFWLKQTTTPKIEEASVGANIKRYCAVFPGLEWNPTGYPEFPEESSGTWPSSSQPFSNVWNNPNNTYSSSYGSNWIVEEARIKGGFNNTPTDYGVRAYLRDDVNTQRIRKSSLIYSGIYNARTRFNETNVFSIGQDITRTVDPHNGSVQLIYAMDNNLTIFQENKVSTGLIDKDTIYTTEGGTQTMPPGTVIGQITPYVGEYGISRNPESFASFGFRRYFADRDRNAVLRLSRDGLTPISRYGMTDYFRDNLSTITDTPVNYSSYEYDLLYNAGTGVVTQTPPYPIPFPIPAQLGGPSIDIIVAAVGEGDGSDIEIGSTLEYNLDPSVASNIWTSISSTYVTGFLDITPTRKQIFLTEAALPINGVGLDPKIRFVSKKKERIEGGYDVYKDNYVLSIQQRSGSKTDDLTSDYYSTIAFDDSINGWTTFYTYRPGFIFSLKSNFYSTYVNSLYRHYDTSVAMNEFYGVANSSSVTFVFNDGPSMCKNFKTISYEGSNGWKVESFKSDLEGPLSGVNYQDTTNAVYSYDEGAYVEGGITYRVGFHKKEGKYYANLVNNSSVRPEEINYGVQMTGIKGYIATVKLSTDATTDVGGTKELFSASSEIVKSS